MFAMPALLRLLYSTGLRGGEALALAAKDVNLNDQYLIVRDSKNGQERAIPFSDSMAAVQSNMLSTETIYQPIL